MYRTPSPPEARRPVRRPGRAAPARPAGSRRHGQGGRLEAEACGDGDVLGADGGTLVEVGERARDAEDAAVATGGQAVAVVELVEEPHGARAGLGVLSQLAGRHLGVAGEAVALQAGRLTLPRGHDALADG